MSEATYTTSESAFILVWREIAERAHQNSTEKGFWDDYCALLAQVVTPKLRNYVIKLRHSQLRDLIISEIGEACEGDRKDLASEKLPGFSNAEEEYADAIIRLMDMAAGMKLRIGEAVVAKMKYNAGRPAMHGGKSF